MPNNSLIYGQIIEAINSQTPCMLASVIYTENSTSATVGDKALISNDGGISGWIGGGCCQRIVKDIAPQLLKENSSCVIRVCPEQAFVDNMRCYPSHCPSEGTVDIFLEPIANQRSVYLYGNTPIAQSIARYSDELSIHLEWRQLPDQYAQNTSNSNANVAIVATQGQGDLAALKQVLADEVEYVLLIASRKKATALKEKLQQSGVNEKAINKIIAPAGIDIGATSGPEIALSVMAKIVSLRSQLSSQTSPQALQGAKENKTSEELSSKETDAVEVVPIAKTSSSCCEDK